MTEMIAEGAGPCDESEQGEITRASAPGTPPEPAHSNSLRGSLSQNI